jgi:peptidyl-dipeptidase A
MDLANDIRSLMNIEANPRWWRTAHHELGHGHYFMCYTRPEVPPLLRTSANPGFHEGIAEIGGMASLREAYLQQNGVLPTGVKSDPVALLLNEALTDGLPFMFWASGTMTHWEADVYAGNLPPDQWNARWWKYVRDFQGVEPPAPRGEEWCDAATKTHVNVSPCYYPNYAFATVLKFQLNDYIARQLLHESPQSCSLAGHPEVGALLRTLMAKGATVDWRKLLRETTGEDLSTRAMVEYFKPLQAWLEEQNKGRPIGWH